MIRLTLLTLTLTLLTACSGSDVVATLEQRPTGVENELLSWTIEGRGAGPRHTVFLGVDIDEAQLMGWARTDRPYGAMLYATLTAPDGTEQWASVRVPVTEQHQIGEDEEANTVQIAYLAAGAPLPNGYRRVPTVRAFSFKPAAGTHTLSVKLMAPKGGEKKALKGLHTVRAELQSRGGAEGLLTGWTAQPPLLPEKPKPFEFK